jgi:hypothetical protein
MGAPPIRRVCLIYTGSDDEAFVRHPGDNRAVRGFMVWLGKASR